MTDPDELRALLVLRLLPGLGDRGASRLLRSQGSAGSALSLPPEVFAGAAGATAERARRDPAITRRADAILERCRRSEIRLVPMGGADYPAALLALVDPPPILFMRGEPGLLRRPCVAVVGSRRATPVGRRVAERLGRELSEAGVTVVSGMALGIDGAAHRGALQGVGGTVAVLGSGPDRAYPAGNREVFRRILRDGLVMSEFPPGEPALPYHFPRRNRILAGVSRAVVVVEATRRSGALITVDHATDLGLEVFAVPGSVETPQSEGVNALLQDGVHLLLRARDLLEVMGWTPVEGGGPPAESGAPATEPVEGGDPLTADSRAVAGALDEVPRSLDDVVGAAGLPPARVLAALMRLELAGAARRGADGWRGAG